MKVNGFRREDRGARLFGPVILLGFAGSLVGATAMVRLAFPRDVVVALLVTTVSLFLLLATMVRGFLVSWAFRLTNLEDFDLDLRLRVSLLNATGKYTLQVDGQETLTQRGGWGRRDQLRFELGTESIHSVVVTVTTLDWLMRPRASLDVDGQRLLSKV